MPLECSIVCVDNSEYMRNGDFAPTRMAAQLDAVNMICSAKCQSHPENTVGIVSCGGTRAEVLLTPTSDLGKILGTLSGIGMSGSFNFKMALQMSNIALKHRPNRSHPARIIIFVGSPIAESREELIALGKRLKKASIAVDVVNFGEENLNTEKLEDFLSAVNSRDNSHLVTVPAGPHFLADLVLSSPICTESGEGADVERFAQFGGVNPELDPDLAWAMQASLADARGQAAGAASAEAPPAAEREANEEERALQEAINISLGRSTEEAGERMETEALEPHAREEVEEEDEEMLRAIRMSMEASGQATTSEETRSGSDDLERMAAETLNDPRFMNEVLSMLPGVDANDEAIKEALRNKEQEGGKKEKDDDEQQK